MLKVQVGQPRVGKTKVVKQIIHNTEQKTLIFDFNDDFNDIEGVRVEFENYHPLIGALTLDEVKILNAGYLDSSRCLFNKAQEIFNEEKVEARENIVRDAIERLHTSWESYEMEYARELSERIPFKVGVKQEKIDEIVQLLEDNQTVIVTAKNIHSNHLRSMLYLLLYKLSNREDLNVKIIADEISTLFFKGNIKLFLEVVNLEKLDIIVSSNRPSNIPKFLKTVVDEWSLFKNTDKAEVKYLKTHFGIGKFLDFEKIPVGKFETVVNDK